jgi:hypothetical protein
MKTAHKSSRLRRRLRGLVAVAAALAATMGLASGAAAATPAPAWAIHSLPEPTHFAPAPSGGDRSYEIVIANSGGAANDGSPVTITDTLPVGIKVEAVHFERRVDYQTSPVDFGPSLCKTEKPGAAEIVRCTIPSKLTGLSKPSVLEPSEELEIQIEVSAPTRAEGETLTNHVQIEGGGAEPASVTSENEVSSAPAPPGIAEFRAQITDVAGRPVTAAGSHPYQYTTSFAVNTRSAREEGQQSFPSAGGDVKDIRVALPPGLVGNPTATARCTIAQFNQIESVIPPGSNSFYLKNGCPEGSAVGLLVVQRLELGGQILPVPIYNLVPPPGMPAQLGFNLLKASYFIDTSLVREDGEDRIVAEARNITQVKRVTSATVTIWGTPGDASHDPLRGSCLKNEQSFDRFSRGLCDAGLIEKPFLRMPTSCEQPLVTDASIDLWPNPGVFARASSSQPALVDCAALDFSPTITARPQTTVADSPSGLRFNLHIPQSDDPGLLATADLRDAVVTLPEGVTVNPASANGLAACSPAQIDLEGSDPAQCPDASKVGSVRVDTPLLDHPLPGAVYVATQNENPFNSLLAIYIVLDDPQSGIVVKLAGHVALDPRTGRLTTRFTDNPQLPFEDFTVEFFDGPRAPLRTPTTCGTYATTTSLKPWSAPESGVDATPSDSFAVTTAPGGGPCAASEAALPHRPSFAAGTLAPVAGAYSPLVTDLDRADGTQTLSGLSVTLPEGLLAKLAGTSYCPDAAIAAAGGKSGRSELASPSCPVSSLLGTVDVGAGAGSAPVNVNGKVYLAGPYKGAPLSLAVLTPAVAGPFDLGTVAVRAALRVNPVTTQATVVSDPFPTILEGIPLDLRSIHVHVDRRQFTLNPTDCEPKSIGANATSIFGQGAALSDRFQVGGCRGLEFAPRLSIRLLGATKRVGFPSLRAELRAAPGQANIARTAVTLPHSAFLEQGHIRTICTRVQFAADQCPAASIYGRATAFSPLLDQPLRGPVYLRSSDNPLPDLVADLKGQVDIELVGRIDSVNRGIRTSFDAVPDAPVSRFILQMRGGKRGLLVNSTYLCRAKGRATVRMDGQNGRAHDFRPLVRNQCGKGKRKAHHS